MAIAKLYINNVNALVTGGCGYFGSLLARRLRQEGFVVRVFDINGDLGDSDGIEMQTGDIRDPLAVARACRQIDVVFHNVAQVPLARESSLFWSVNRDGMRVLLEAAAGAGVRKIVYTSSSAVFGVPDRNPVTEQTPPKPREDYGRAKLAGEDLCRQAAAAGLDVTILRPRTILGHGRLGIFHILFEWVRRGCNIPVLGAGDNIYQFVHADDLAQACLLAARRPGAALYHCGASRFGTMRETLQALCDHAKTGSQVRGVPKSPTVALMKLTSALRLSPLAAYHALMYGESLYFDLTKITTELGWRAVYSNAEMIIESYEWYLKHRESLADARGDSAHRSLLSPGILELIGRWL